jgi:hypothetical protein
MESKFTKKVCGILKNRGALVFACMGTEYQSGWPDRYVSHKRWRGWIEFKSLKRRLELNQKITIQQLRQRGDNAIIIRETYSPEIGRLEDVDGTCIRTFYVRDILELLCWHTGKTEN